MFIIPEEVQQIVDLAHDFGMNEIHPSAADRDKTHEYPADIIKQLGEMGFMGMFIPEEYGGMGLDLTTYVMIVEELSRGWISISGIINTHFTTKSNVYSINRGSVSNSSWYKFKYHSYK